MPFGHIVQIKKPKQTIVHINESAARRHILNTGMAVRTPTNNKFKMIKQRSQQRELRKTNREL